MEGIGVGRRAVAVIIDAVPLFIVGYIIALVTGGATRDGFDIRGGPAFLWLAIGLAYYIIMEALWGATLGKRAMGLKVVKQGGEPLDWKASIVRNLMRIVDGFLFYLVAAIAVWVSKSRQRLGDMAANTLVVKTQLFIPLLVALACGGFHHAESAAASPRYSDMVLSDAKDGAAKNTFTPDTAKIFLRTKLVDIPAGSVAKSEWIAVKTKVAAPNYKIDSTQMKIGRLMNRADFNFSKPTAGWPEGDYRIDLFIDDKLLESVKFRVVK